MDSIIRDINEHYEIIMIFRDLYENTMCVLYSDGTRYTTSLFRGGGGVKHSNSPAIGGGMVNFYMNITDKSILSYYTPSEARFEESFTDEFSDTIVYDEEYHMVYLLNNTSRYTLEFLSKEYLRLLIRSHMECAILGSMGDVFI